MAMQSYFELCQLAISDLTEQFDIVGKPIDLTLVHGLNGKKMLFDALQASYRPCFHHHQRIIVIQPEHDVYDFSEDKVSSSLIVLQQTLQLIDISNFFVIVISCNPTIQTELQECQAKYSTDSHSIQSYKVDGTYQQFHVEQDTFCVLPWMHLHVNTDLEALPCCVADQDLTWGDWVQNSVEDLINCDKAKTMRLKMLSGQKCRECSSCYSVEKNGHTSRRQRENNRYQHLIQNLKANTKGDGSITEFRPLNIDVRLSNTCNLKCRTCDGRSSSRIAQEEFKLFGNKENLLHIKSVDERSKAFDKILPQMAVAQEILFTGGEPLIIADHYKILDYLIKIEKFDVNLIYITNLTVLKHKKFNMLDYWKQFPFVNVNASIDGHHEIFEYVRHGARWADIENNYALLKKECPHIDFSIFSTVSIYSARSIMELQKMWHDNHILDISKFKLNIVKPVDNFNLQTLLQHHKVALSKQIDEHCQWLQSQKADTLAASWQSIKRMMWSDDQSNKNQLVGHVNRARDRFRGQSFETLYPEYQDLFDVGID